MAGKSVLCARLIRHLQKEQSSVAAFFVCNFRTGHLNTCSNLLRIIAGQLIKQRQDLAGLVYEQYILKGCSPSKKSLKDLIQILLSGVCSARLIVDGLDECTDEEQREVISAIRFLTENNPSSIDCKAIIFSRDIPTISKGLKKSAKISLKEEVAAVESSIKTYVHHDIHEIRDELDEFADDFHLLDEIERKIVTKADGTKRPSS